MVAVLLALALGVAGGWAYSAAQESDEGARRPVAAAIEPVPADPTLPVEVDQPDSDEPALETGIPLEATRLTLDDDGREYALDLEVPAGWVPVENGALWRYTVPGNSDTSYGLRVEIIAAEGRTVDRALSARLGELDSAEAQGNLSDLDYSLLATGDGFTATYTDGSGFDRVSIEQFYDSPGDVAFATVAVYGRERDRTGLRDLLARVTTSLRTSET